MNRQSKQIPKPEAIFTSEYKPIPREVLTSFPHFEEAVSFHTDSRCAIVFSVVSVSTSVILLLSDAMNFVRTTSLMRLFGGSVLKRSVPVISSSIGAATSQSMSDQGKESKEELKKRLSPIQYHVTQEKGTERAFTGKYNKTKDAGIYSCIVCSQDLFSSTTKFESGCGWPAFSDVIDQGKVKLSKDTSHVGANLLLLIANPGMVRTEVTCSSCGAHLGHVFNDGPKPTRKRFCINSASLNFRSADLSDSNLVNLL